jgi:hypothetical protein
MRGASLKLVRCMILYMGHHPYYATYLANPINKHMPLYLPLGP